MVSEGSKRDEIGSFATVNDDKRTNRYKGKIGPVRQRREKIRQMVQKNGFATIENLAQQFGQIS